MSIIRSPAPQSNFYILDKRISEDDRLTWAARGMLVFLLGKPDHWRVNIQALVNSTGAACRPIGKTAVYAIINELLDVGYMTRQKHADGTLDYWVHDFPQTRTDKGSEPDSGNPNLANPNLDNQPLVSTEKAVKIEKAVRTKKAAAPLVLPEWLDPQLWEEWSDYRKKRDRRPASDHSKRLWLRDMTAVKDAGLDVRKSVENSIANNWAGIFLPKSDPTNVSSKHTKSLNDMDYSADLF
jgi:hypothetical protein